MDSMIMQVFYGVAASATYAAFGYLKTQDNTGKLEELDVWKLVKSVALGGLIGGIASYSGIAPEAVVALPTYGFAAALIESGLKAIRRRFF